MPRMDAADRALLHALIADARVAALATLRAGAPMASMLPFIAAPDLSAFHVHVSRLAWHTQDMAADARVALAIAERDDARDDPYALARVSIRGDATELAAEGEAFAHLKAAWLARHPATAINFELADFRFWRIAPRDARFVAGYGRIHNLAAADLRAG